MRGHGFAIAIIIACGVAMMIMSLGALTSLQASQDTYYERYRFADIFAQVKRAPESLIRDISNIEGVRFSETRIKSLVTLDVEGFEEPTNGLFISLPDKSDPTLNRVLLHMGRWPDPGRPEEIVANKAFTDAHEFEPGDQISGVLNGLRRDLTVVGIGDSPEFIYTLGPDAFLPDDKRFGVFFMRRKALEAAFDMDGAFNDVSLKLSPNAKLKTVIDELNLILGPYGGIGAYDREDQLSHAFIESEMGQLRSMARIIPPVFLIVSALLLNAILGRLISTERQQIGILKAFGYTNRSVSWHYIKLAMAITVVGVVIGFALGAVLARLLTHLYSDSFRFPVLLFHLSPLSFVIGAGAAIFAAIIGALNAALKAARLEPAEAMHPAPPAGYRRSRLQKLGAKLPFDEPTRMIIRHVRRWPGRSATTILGVAASMGLLVGTLFSFDAIDSLTDTFFYRTDPYEAVFSFTEPRGNEAIIEFARLPGVISVEPSRNAVARLKNGPKEERIGVFGLLPDAKNKRVIDRQGQYTTLPSHGLTLSTQLSRMMDARIGDVLTIEFLMGRRPILEIPVTAIVEDFIGASAYMDKTRLNRILMEDDVVTGGYAKLDPAAMPAFRRAVLERPIINNVTLQSAAIRSFEETLDETISIMMNIYALIGGAIAASVVYNAARIALTERGRELASMRVLGFTKSEVSYILIGELTILTLVALPLGCLFGAALAWSIATSMSTKLFRVPLVIEASTYGVSALIVLVAGLVSAVLVIRRVSQLDMISVLKTKE